jgi:hypothetical protein
LFRFVFALLLTAGLILALVKFTVYSGWIQRAPTSALPTLILMVLSTAIIYRYLYRLQNPSQFVILYLLLMVMKLVLYLGYNIFLVLKRGSDAVPNVVFFLIVYCTFTALEIGFLYRHINRRIKP